MLEIILATYVENNEEKMEDDGVRLWTMYDSPFPSVELALQLRTEEAVNDITMLITSVRPDPSLFVHKIWSYSRGFTV